MTQSTIAPSTVTLTTVIAKAAVDHKAQNIVGLDTRTVTSFADEFISATGPSNRHVRAVADAIMEEAKAFGRMPEGKEGYDEGRWILLDFGEVIVHIFQDEVRKHYDLERLWSEAPALEFASLGVELPSSPDADRPSRDKRQIRRVT